MKILFIADELATFKIYKDTTYAMMRRAQAGGHEIFSCLAADLVWQNTHGVQAACCRLSLIEPPVGDSWYEEVGREVKHLAEFDVVVMRQDPPFDSEYFYAAHLLHQAEREGALVVNKAAALYGQPEKLSILEFTDFIAPTIVTSQESQLRRFYQQHRDIILKPLDGMGGSGVFRVDEHALNFGAILEMLTNRGKTTVMAQQYLPAIQDGDKRVLVIGGEVVPYSLARIPQGGEVRGNLAAGGKGVAMPLTATEQQVARAVAEVLWPRGLYLIGLDLIGGKLTEINVTSPTCFQEISNQTGYDVAQQFIKTLETAVKNRRK